MCSDRGTYAAHALVDKFSSDDWLAGDFDARHAAAERVAVGLLAHHTVCKSKHILTATIVGPPTSPESGFVVGDVTRA